MNTTETIATNVATLTRQRVISTNLATLAEQAKTGDAAVVAAQEAEAILSDLKADLTRAYRKMTRDDLAAAATERGITANTASKAAVVRALVDSDASIPSIAEPYNAIVTAADQVRRDRSARRDAVDALDEWAAESFPAVTSHGDEAMKAEFDTVLGRFGKAFVEARAEHGEDEALRRTLAWAMKATLGNDNGLGSAYQIRVSDIAAHLARSAAHQYIVRSLAHGVLGSAQAQRLGIQREWRL